VISTMHTESETASFSGRILKESVSLMYRCYLRVWGYAAKPRDHMLNQLHEKAWVATRHRYVQTYRGVLLFADDQGVTAMIDSHTWQYIEASPDKLLFLPTIEEAKFFIDSRV
jgi:hypothetical protein